MDKQLQAWITQAQQGDLETACALARALDDAGDEPGLASLAGHLHRSNSWETLAAVARALQRPYSGFVESACGPDELRDITLTDAAAQALTTRLQPREASAASKARSVFARLFRRG